MTKNHNAHTFFEHLDELKGRLIKCLVVLTVSSIVFYSFADGILRQLIKPVGQIVFTSLSDAFMAKIQLTLIGGFLLASPYIFFHVWEFVSEGLSANEKKFVKLYAPASFLFFFLGIAFAYFVVIPLAVKFLLSYGNESMVPMITVDNYISFVGTMILAFGVIFEMPLVLLFLTKIGIATPAFLIEKRRHAIVLILIISAVLTPPDIISQILMALPLIILYEIGIVFSKASYAKQILKTQL